MLTADTITDEQIRELRAQASGNTVIVSDATTVDSCDIALGWIEHAPCLNTHPAHDCVGLQRVNARARCAEILNARSRK
jgi:hypothetical protein